MQRIAAVDIGTVTMRVLIADVDECGTVSELHRDICLTHIGKDLSRTGELSDEGMQTAFAAWERFAIAIEEYHPEKVVCVATSAARDAQNSDEFLMGLLARGLQVHIISGDREALLSFRGAAYQRNAHDLLVIDPGGGSTECIFSPDGRDESALIMRSLNIGSRRLTDMFLHEPLATIEEITATRNFIADMFTPFFDMLPVSPCELVAMAGTATTLVTIRDAMDEYDPQLVQGQRVSAAELDEMVKRLAGLTIEERKSIVGLEPKRADVILAGVLIIAEILRITGLSELTISDYDILYGIILSADLF